MDSTAVIAICAAVLGTGGLSTLAIALINRKPTVVSTMAQAGLTEAQRKEVDERSATTVATREREQELFWRGLLKETEDRCNEKVAAVHTELDVLETFVDMMVPWSWGAIRELKLAAIDYEKPPSLAEIKMRIKGATQPSLRATPPPSGPLV